MAATTGTKQRLSDGIAQALQEDILGLSAGDRLPTEAELVERFDVSRTVIREATRLLVQRGLVDRTEDATDRRMKRLRLTTKGRELVLKMRELRMAGFEQFVATLSPKERNALAKALEPILARDDVVAFCGGRK